MNEEKITDSAYLAEYFKEHAEYATMLYFKIFDVSLLDENDTYKYCLAGPHYSFKCNIDNPEGFTLEEGDKVYLSDKVSHEMPRTRFNITMGDVASPLGRKIFSELQVDLIFVLRKNGDGFIFKKFYY